MLMYDLTGQRFGKLTVLFRQEGSGGLGKEIYWICECDCGNLTSIRSYSLRKQGTKSCGCLRVQFNKTKQATKHGMYNTRTYHSWEAMKQRCLNPKAKNYYNYGDLGIKICDHWQVFDNFFADMGERPEGTSLDRIDPFGNYEPGNCRWSTPKEQANNKRRHRKSEGGE